MLAHSRLDCAETLEKFWSPRRVSRLVVRPCPEGIGYPSLRSVGVGCGLKPVLVELRYCHKLGINPVVGTPPVLIGKSIIPACPLVMSRAEPRHPTSHLSIASSALGGEIHRPSAEQGARREQRDATDRNTRKASSGSRHVGNSRGSQKTGHCTSISARAPFSRPPARNALQAPSPATMARHAAPGSPAPHTAELTATPRHPAATSSPTCSGPIPLIARCGTRAQAGSAK